MPDCYRCNIRPAVTGDGLCEICAHAHMGGAGSQSIPAGKSFDTFYKESLEGKSVLEGLLIADDVLLQYEYYKYDDRFLPVLDGGIADYTDEHAKLENFFFKNFFSIFRERIMALDGLAVSDKEFFELQTDFFRFHSTIIQFLLRKSHESEQGQLKYAGTQEAAPVQLLLKKQLILIGRETDSVDISSKEFDPGSALFFLELYVLLKEQNVIRDLQKLLANRSKNPDSVIHQPLVMITPWRHQKLAYDSWRNNQKKGIIEMATATGKTLVGLMAVEELFQQKPRGTVRVFAHSTNILNQWRREVIDKLGLTTGVSGEYTTPILIDGFSIHFNTVQMVIKDPPSYPADLLIVDEVHHLAAPEFKKALAIPCPRKMGLSATVEGDQKLEILKDELGDIVYQLSLNEALETAVLPTFKWVICPVFLSVQEEDDFSSVTESIRKTFISVKNDSAISELSGGRISSFHDLNEFIRFLEFLRYKKHNIPEKWRTLLGLIQKRRWIIHRSYPRLQEALKLASEKERDHKVIIFAMDIQTCDIIAESLQSKLPNIYVVHSKVKDNVDNLITAFRKAGSGVLIGARMLDEGIDIPDADIGINVASSKTRLQLVQRLGRILRKKHGKNPVFYHYVAIPERKDIIAEEDNLGFLDDLSWVQDTAMKMGMNVDVQFSDDIIRSMASDAEQSVSHQYAKTDRNTVPQLGTFRIDNILSQFTPDAVSGIIDQLKNLEPDYIISDQQWSVIVKHAFNKKDTDRFELRGFWWLLILADRNPVKLIHLFNPDFIPEVRTADKKETKERETIQEEKLTAKEIKEMGKEAVNLYNSKKYLDSIGVCNQILKNRNVSSVFNLKGACFIAIHDYGNAAECFRKALEIEPDKTEFWKNLSVAYDGMGMKDKAVECLRIIDQKKNKM